MSGLALEVRSGRIYSRTSTLALRRILSDDQALEDALADSVNNPARYTHFSQVAPDTLVGFVPYPERPREIIVAQFPFARQVVPAVSLRVAGDDWRPNPQLISINQLKQYDGVIVAADWLTFLVNQAASICNPKVHEHGIDRSLLAIGGAWERWERTPMTWPQRCEDLARLTGVKELRPNTLLNKCKRLGLIHSDNKVHSASRDKQELVA